jgi:ABC-type amino acid transport substrate-binding protein
MFRRLLLTGFLLAALVLPDRNLFACGDKFLVLGRSVGYQSLLKASKPGTVVLYNTSSLPKSFSDGAFDLLMNVAGHQLRTVSDQASLTRALASGKVDLVLADTVTSRQINASVNTSSTAVVVPIVMNTNSSERAVFEKEFGCMLRLPADARKVIDALDRAMKLRAKRSAAHAA